MKNIILFLTLTLSVLSCKQNKNSEDFSSTDEYYTCSMDPQVIAYKPGICPICKMSLTKVKKSQSLKSDEIELSDQQIQLGNIQTEAVSKHILSGQNSITSTLKINESLVSIVSAKVIGRIDKLYFKNPGDFVKAGDLIFDLYSEEINVVKQEYVIAYQNKDKNSGLGIDYNQLVEAAKAKLLLYGLTENQVSQLEHNSPTDVTSFYSPASGYISEMTLNEGQYVILGQEIMKLADLSSLWVEVQTFNSQIGKLQIGTKIQVSFPGTEIKTKEAVIDFINPVSSSGTRLTQFRAKVENKENTLKPGMIAYVNYLNNETESLSVPANAVIRDTKNAAVWLKISKNKFKYVMVETGTESNGFVEIKSGISLTDTLVISGAYLINSEFILKKGSSPMEGHKM